MPKFGFCAGFYTSSLINADCQTCMNFYPEKNESGAGKSEFQLLPTPGTRTFARIYEEVAGLAAIRASYQGAPVLTLPAGDYYAALALINSAGVAVQRSRVFGPFRVLSVSHSPSPPFVQTFAGTVPLAPAPGSNWFIYFGTSRTNLNQRLAIGSAAPITFGDDFLTELPTSPDYLLDPAMAYVITPNGLAQPTPGTGPAWYVLLNGPEQGNQSASVTIPHFDTTHTSFSVGVLVRAQGPPTGPTSFYVLGLSTPSPQIAIYRNVNGVSTTLVSQNTIAIPDGSVLALRIVGATLTASLNGVDILTVVDNTLLSGTTGFITTGPAISNFLSSTTPVALSLVVSTPGASAQLPDAAVAGAIYEGVTIDDRCYIASETGLWQLYSDGYARFLATIINDFKPKVFAKSPIEIMLSAGGHLYRYHFANDVVTDMTNQTTTLADGTVADMLQGPVVSTGFADGYFIALLIDGRFQISELFEDADETTGVAWDPTDITKESVFADTPTSMIIDHREIRISGPRQSISYYNSGNQFFPFDVIPGSFAENGTGAPASVVKADNTYWWIDADERGGGIARKAQGYTPIRVSHHAIEEHWRKFSTFADAISFSYQEAGHTFIVNYFPAANESWVHDIGEGQWHERTKHVRCHVYAFGKHLVGDVKTGTIYEQSVDLVTHDGAEIRRVRRAPHISKEQGWITHESLQIDLETGVGPMPPLVDGHGEPRNPQMMMRFTDDGGHRWSNEQIRDCGAAGEYKKRVIFRRLGRSRDRVYEMAVTDPVQWRVVEAYLNPQDKA